MYDRGVTEKLVQAERDRTAHEKDPLDRFLGTYHSFAECQEFVRHANQLIDEEGNFKRQLTKTERQWIRNERVLCTLDFRYWLARYARIVDFRNQLTNFTPNIAQNLVIDVWAEMERLRWAIMMIQLKARQLGVSTLTELAVQHRIQFYPDVNAVVASCEDDKSAKMAHMLELSLTHQPWFLMPKNLQWKIGKYIKFDNNSALSVESGNQLSGIAMGTTPQVAHISEVAKIRNAKVLIEQSLLHAVHEDPFTFLVLESTAEGFENWFYTTWVDAMAYWGQGKATLCPLFLPWFVGTDIYPTQAWIRKHPVPENWVPSEETMLHARSAAVAVRTNPRLASLYPSDWTMPKTQQWFYEVRKEEAVRKNEVNTFLSEMPADPDEAFQSSNKSVVDPAIIKRYKETALAVPPGWLFEVLGSKDELPTQFEMHRRIWLTDKKPMRLKTWVSEQYESEYKFVPLKFESYQASPNNKLFVWEWPKDGEEYGIGVDTSDGVDQDNSIVSIWKRATVWTPWTQVAEFASPYMNAMDFWPIVQAIATFYSVVRGGQMRQPKLVIECRGTGDLLQNELRKRGWSNFHIPIRIDKKRIDPSKQHYMGIMTSPWQRRQMLDKYISMFKAEELDINSPYLVEETRRLEVDEEKMKIAAGSGAKDDRVLASCFVLISLDVFQMSPRVRRRADPEEEDPSYVDTQASSDDMEIKSLTVATKRRQPVTRL